MGETAVRHPKRGRAHLLVPGTDSTVCGKFTRDMTERLPAESTAPEDRCKRCFLVQPA